MRVLLLLLCLPILFLFTPVPPDNDCLRTVRIGEHARFIHICDSYSITSATENLGKYFSSDNPWRSRPVYIITATALAAAFSPVATAVQTVVIAPLLHGDFDSRAFQQRYPHYFALSVINVIILATTLLLAIRLCGGQGTPTAIALGAVIATSDIVHGLFWSHHPSFMNLLVPVGAVFAFLQGCRTRATGQGGAGFGAATAAAVLIYAYAVIWIPAFLVGWLFAARSISSTSRPPSALFAAIAYTASACLPVVAWMILNRYLWHLPVAYEASAAGQGQFVWLSSAFADGTLRGAMVVHFEGFWSALKANLGLQALIPITVAGGLWLLAGNRLAVRHDPVLVGVLVAGLGMLLFNFLQGYYTPRQETPMILLFWIAAARLFQRSERERLGAVMLGLGAMVQVVQAFLAPALSMT